MMNQTAMSIKSTTLRVSAELDFDYRRIKKEYPVGYL